jgi:uncharacterized protein YndB with AHSA1/START domain
MSDTVAALVIRRLINASPARCFAAWTEPRLLMQWWGPAGVDCHHAEVDLREGGSYRIANRFADGSVLWIVGTFEHVDPPHELVYSWRLEPGEDRSERVTVRFEPHGDATEIVVVHEHITAPVARERHDLGWHGCIDGLAALLERPQSA